MFLYNLNLKMFVRAYPNPHPLANDPPPPISPEGAGAEIAGGYSTTLHLGCQVFYFPILPMGYKIYLLSWYCLIIPIG